MIKFQSLNDYNQVWLTSDSHLAHKNICRGTSKWTDTSRCRDFDTVEEMDAAILKGLEVVREDDVLIHMGDVAFGGKNNIPRYVESCKGPIIHIIGNHDHNVIRNPGGFQDLFAYSAHQGYFKFKGVNIFCSHYPTAIWHRGHRGTLHAYGHTHGSYEGLGKSQDVGVDVAFKLFGEYRPFSFEEFVNLADGKEAFLPSHHNKNTN